MKKYIWIILPAFFMIAASNYIEADKTFNVKIEEVYDADTLTVDIDLGFDVVLDNQKLRLHRINAWEVKGEEKPQGIKARDWLKTKIANAKQIYIKPVTSKGDKTKYKKGKFGRWLAELYIDNININDEIVKSGHGKYQSY